jgi:hypothetical protein
MPGLAARHPVSARKETEMSRLKARILALLGSVLLAVALAGCAEKFDMGYGYTPNCPTKNMACSPYINS